MKDDPNPPEPRSAGWFATTRWSIVLAAGRENPAPGRQALAAEEQHAHEPANRLNSDKPYDCRWARPRFGQLLARLRQEQPVPPGRPALFAEVYE